MGQSATQVVMGITGAVVGAVVGGPWGAAAGFAIGYGAGELLMSMLPDVKTPDQSPSDYTLRSSKAANRYILGEAATGGVLTWAQEQAGSQTDNEWLHMVYYLSQGEINSVENIYINDEDISNYGDYISYEVVKMPTTVNAFLLANCTAYKETMIGYGLSYIRVSYKYNTDKYSSGVPSAQFVVKGRTDIYDPRTQTSSYSNNSALCILWYMMEVMGIPEDEIIMDTFIEAANICDEIVTNADNSTSKRYTLGAVIGDDESKVSVLSKLLKTCAGQLNRVGGYWMLQVGAYYGTYDYTITEDMIIGTTEIQTEVDNDNAINIITGTFVDPNSTWADTDYPSVANDIWIASDGGETSEDLSLEYVTDVYQAQRLAWIALKARRNDGGVSTTLDYNGYNCRVGRVVRLYLPSFNVDGEFIVNNWSLSKDGGCKISLSKYSADIFDDTVGQTYVPEAIIQVTANGINPPSNLLWSVYNGSENRQGVFTWSAPNASVEYYGVLIRDNTNALIQSYQVDGSITVCNIDGLNTGIYTFSVYAKSALRKSNEATISVSIDVPVMPEIVTYTSTIDTITIIPSNPVTSINGGTYEYYWATDAVTYPLTEATWLGKGDTITHTGLAFNTMYHYYIRSVNAYGKSGFYHLEASTSADVSALLSALSNQITSDQLTAQLQNDIESLPSIVSSIGTLTTDVTTLSSTVDALNATVNTLLDVADYSASETIVYTGELRKYNGHLYEALSDMTNPIPIPTNPTYWLDRGEFTSILDTINNITVELSSLSSVVNGQATNILALNAQSRDDSGDADINDVLSYVDLNARFVEETIVRADKDEALAQRITTAEASIGDTQAELTTLEQTVATADEALSQRITTNSTSIADTQASLTTLTQTVSTLDTSLSQEITDLSAVVDNNTTDITANAGNISSLSAFVNSPTDGLATKASATSLSELEATVTSPTTGLPSKASASDLTTVAATLDDVQAQRTIKVSAADSSGRYVVAGIALSADGAVNQSKMYFLANQFAFLNAVNGTAAELVSTNTASTTAPLIIQNGIVYINTALINTLTANTITASSLIKSSDGNMVLDFANKTISITV